MKERKAALRVLLNVEKGAFSQEEIIKVEPFLEENSNPAFVRELVYGVLENKILLDHVIGKLSKTPIKKMQIEIIMILRLGIYELLFLDKKAYATINEYVNLSKSYAFKGISGFVNGILRNVDRRGKELLKVEIDYPLKKLSTLYSHPIWILEEFLNQMDYIELEELLKVNNTPPPLYIRKREGISGKILEEELEKEGIGFEKAPRREGSYKLKSPRNISSSKAFTDGLFTIQDLGSQLAADSLDIRGDSRILDLCSAPGGKSVQMAEKLKDGYIISNDIDSSKNDRIEENASRMGVRLEISNRDAREFIPSWENKFDRILIDAPCSGLGLLRKKPEIRWNRKADDLVALAKIQREIIDVAVNYLVEGGLLVYSTCTLTREENEDQVIYIKEKYPYMKEAGPENSWPIKIYPHKDDADGFFISKFIKKS